MDELLKNQFDRMQRLIDELNAASEAYYGGKEEIMSNFEWDAKFDELTKLEETTGTVLPNSPTQNVSTAEEQEAFAGQKVQHEYPALSLAKTKKVEDLQKWAEEKPVWLSWKLDGLTVVCTFDADESDPTGATGRLTRLVTRGNGQQGLDITFMKDAIQGIPKTIPYGGHVVVRGEVVISYPDFKEINAELPAEEQYANPRNLASGTLSLDPSRIADVKARKVQFIAFTLVHIDDKIKSWGERMDFLKKCGFHTVEHEATNAEKLPETVRKWTEMAESTDMIYPVDGLVIVYDDTDYAATGSVTGHHATRAGLAFKWQDEVAVSTLRDVEWSCGATTITPVAIFDPVQLEGTTVSRASLVNISEMERLGIGENGKTEIQVIKANKIIPKIVGINHAIGKYEIPSKCPACGLPTSIFNGNNGVKTLKCNNPECPAKNLKKYERFVSKQGMDIDGLSIESLRDFVAAGMIHDFTDIFLLSKHADEIKAMDGFGDKSCENLMAAIEKSSKGVDPIHLLTALCIPQIGADAAKRLINACGWSAFLDRVDIGYGFADVDGIGEERSKAICDWFENEDNRAVFGELLQLLDITNAGAQQENGGTCAGLTFVITGDVHHFKNRDEFKAYVEAHGGKVAGSVSKKTNFLVNNDATSASSKNRKAQELGIKIITEDEFVATFGS